MPQRTEYLTVPEVMAYLRLGRTTVYSQARLFLATGGAEGIPCRRFGRSLRFPLDELAAFADEPAPRQAAPTAPTAPVHRRPESTPQDGREARPPALATRSRPSSRPPKSRRTASAPSDDTVVQAALPFTD